MIQLLTLLVALLWSTSAFAAQTLEHVYITDSKTVDATDTVNHALRVNVIAGGGTGGTSSSFSATFPGIGSAIGFSNGTNMVPGLVDGSGYIKTNCAVGCAGGSSTPTDAFANPSTAGLSQAFNMIYNGTNWDMMRGDGAKNTMVNINALSYGPLPVTGAFYQGTQPISAASLPLPTLAATSTKQSDGTQKTQIVDGSGNVIASTTKTAWIRRRISQLVMPPARRDYS
jgi:hypothetical protein